MKKYWMLLGLGCVVFSVTLIGTWTWMSTHMNGRGIDFQKMTQNAAVTTEEKAGPVTQAFPPTTTNHEQALTNVQATMSGKAFTQCPPLEYDRQAAEEHDANSSIVIADDFEGGFIPKVTKISSTHFILDFESRPTRMFLFKVSGAKGKTVRIDLEHVDIAKWSSLNPVYCEKEAIEETIDDRIEAFTGMEQRHQSFNNAHIPDTRGQSWHYIENVWQQPIDSKVVVGLSVVQRFGADTAWVAMKYPYIPSMNQRLLEEAAKAPVSTLLTIGTSHDGRPLEILKIGEGEKDDQKHRPTILMYAREHGDEHDSSWAVIGAIRALTSNTQEAHDLLSSRSIHSYLRS